MGDRKLLFISVFNHGALELAKNHLNSLIKNGISNYMAYCTSNETADELRALGYNVETVKFDIDESKLDFSTPQFNKLSYLRYIVILNLMRNGYDVWYLDVDTVVCGNLNEVYEKTLAENRYNMLFQNDINMLCTGCMLILKHPSTERFVIEQYKSSFQHSDHNDQIIFNHILKNYNDPQLRIGMFSPFQFPNGLLYFKDDFVSTRAPQYIRLREEFHSSPQNVLFVHANWMVGVDTKINALKTYGLWIEKPNV